MTLTDTRLNDPTATEVLGALQSAFRAVEGRGARVPHAQVAIKRAATHAATEPEGTENWVSRTQIEEGFAGQVLLAWWTAVSGKRFVRIVGRLVTARTQYLLSGMKLSTRPPVWHVFQDRVYRRRAANSNDMIAVCGCGAVGTEKALGWAGLCCGPCADYRDEHGELPWKRPAFLPLPSACVAVAGSADGRWVAAACQAEVRVWDLDAGAKPVHVVPTVTEEAVAAHIALSADGRWLAVAGRANSRLHITDLKAQPARTAMHMAPVDAVAFQPNRDALHFIAASSILVSEPPDARPSGSAFFATGSGPLVFANSGTRIAVRHGQTIEIHDTSPIEKRSLGTELASLPFPRHTNPHIAPGRSVPRVAFAPDGGHVAIGFGQALAVHHAVTGAQRFADGTLEATVTGLAYSPDGEWLYVGRQDGTLDVRSTATFASERSVVLRWSLGPIHAVAACGDALLTACDEGVQVWPMPKLLEGL